MYPYESIHSLENLTIWSWWGWISFLDIYSFLKVFQYSMSIELPWSTNVFIIAKFFALVVMTMGSFWVGLMSLKSTSIKIIEGILRWVEDVTTFTDCTAQRCHFLVEFNAPPTVNPPTVVLMTLLSGVLRACCSRSVWAPWPIVIVSMGF